MEWVIPAILVLLSGWGALLHRRLSALRRSAISAWSPLEAGLRQRHDLVAPLAQALQGLPAKEQQPVQAMIKARNAAIAADLSPLRAGRAEAALGAAIQAVISLAREKAALEGQAKLQRLLPLLDGAERDIAAAEVEFNHGALVYNRACSHGPSYIVARLMSFFHIEYFGVAHDDRAALQRITRHSVATGRETAA